MTLPVFLVILLDNRPPYIRLRATSRFDALTEESPLLPIRYAEDGDALAPHINGVEQRANEDALPSGCGREPPACSFSHFLSSRRLLSLDTNLTGHTSPFVIRQVYHTLSRIIGSDMSMDVLR